MAFSLGNLTTNNEWPNNLRYYSYSTSDTLATVQATDYWDGSPIREGDVVAVTCSDGKFFGRVGGESGGGFTVHKKADATAFYS